ncbi:LOW QUALITY PROTEIN: zona pellucida sperm-binding protein 4-like [Xiphias gladius]|uniref:LOW QUALITY PROTEIN: zona pellucida sperm-binding protein 4-like n=1 Tax=Xiphias gladius TaxID=8245 RepID=UPI001A993185|nr:LOW QUALITY PROTEIN: zona pellucida sperm-binding protein 4-like [Xiphias gladius]
MFFRLLYHRQSFLNILKLQKSLNIPPYQTYLNILKRQSSNQHHRQSFLNILKRQSSDQHHRQCFLNILNLSTISLPRNHESLQCHRKFPLTRQVHHCKLLSRVVKTQNVRIPCGGPDISAAGCEAIKCCFDGRQCYFGKAVTVQCTKDAQFIVVVAKDATLPNIDLESISLLEGGQGCTHVDSNSDFAIYHFPVTACGSFVMEEPGVIIYENRMSSSYEVGLGPLGAITRDSFYELQFRCRYIGTSVETVVAEVLRLQDPPLSVAALGPIRVHLRLANGQCYTKGCNEEDVAYSSFYTEADYPVIKVLRDPVYVEVQLIEKTDPNLVLTLGRCWTTTSPNPHSLPQWDILTDGCPWMNDRYLSSLVPVGPSSGLDFPSHYRRFIFKMFTFVDANSLVPLKEQVYIHCSTAVCTAALGHSCEPSCFRRKRDVETADQSKAGPKVVVSVGPVIMTDPKEQPAQNV